MAIAPYIVSFRYNHRWWSDLWICWGISWSTLAQTLVLWTGVSQYCLQHAFPVCANFLHLNLFFVMISFQFLYKVCSLSSFRKKHYTRRHVVPEVVLVLAYGRLAIQPELISESRTFVAPQGFFMCFLGLGAQISVILQSVLWSDSALKNCQAFSTQGTQLFDIWKLQRISYDEYLWYDILHF